MEPGKPSDHAADTRRSLLQRVLAVSARSVAPGGESGALQWLLPTLVVLVIYAGGFLVVKARHGADRPSARGAPGAAVADTVVRSQAEAAATVVHRNGPRAVAQLRASMSLL